MFPACFTGLGAFVAYHPIFSDCGAKDPLLLAVLFILILVPVVTVFLLNVILFYKAAASGMYPVNITRASDKKGY